MRYDWVVNRRNEIRRIAKLYQSKKSAFRELVTNSLDAYGDLEREMLKNNDPTVVKKIVSITVPVKGDGNNKMSCLDFATGIKNIKHFAMLFESSKEDEESSAGEYGIGRISCFGLTKDTNGKLIYVTNNGDIERKLVVDTAGFDDDDQPVSNSSGKSLLNRRGCLVTVTDLDMDLFPTPKQIINYLSGTFGLKLLKDHNIEITVNGEIVPVNKELEPFRKTWSIHDSVTLKLEGNLMQYNSGTGVLWLYKKNIRIGNNPKDVGLEFRVKGWINCDQFELTPDRDNVSENTLFDIVKNEMSTYCVNSNFKRIEKDPEDDIALSPLKSRRLIDKMTGLLDSLISSTLFKERFSIPQIVIQKKQEVEVDLFDHPEIVQQLEKIKRMTGLDTISGNTGGSSGKKVEGFDVSGHKHHIEGGAGTGIHTHSNIKSDGTIPTISEPVRPLSKTVEEAVGTTPYQNSQIQKVKQMMTVDIKRPGGFEHVQIPFGDGRPPIFVKDNRIILNTTNKIFQACLKHELGYISLYSIALAHLFKDFDDVDQYQRDMYIFEIMKHNLKQLGYI